MEDRTSRRARELLMLLACVAFASGARAQECANSMDDLLMSASGRYHAQVKEGEPKLSYWLPPHANKQQVEFNEWLVNGLVYGNVSEIQKRPPRSSPCTILFNHKYRFIFVKNTKTAGSSIFLFFGGYCGKDGKGLKGSQVCFERIGGVPEELARGMWRNYTVFGTTRNPFSRAGSAYDYLLGRRPTREGACRDPPFDTFCSRPNLLGVHDRLFRCLDDPIHDFHHVEPQTPCFVAPDGKPAVDFLLRYETLEDDFQELLRIINEKRRPELPELKGSLGWAQKGPIEKGNIKSERSYQNIHTAKFEACGEPCVDGISAYYADDLEFLQYPNCAASS